MKIFQHGPFNNKHLSFYYFISSECEVLSFLFYVHTQRWIQQSSLI